MDSRRFPLLFFGRSARAIPSGAMAIKPGAVYGPSHPIDERLGGGPFPSGSWSSLSFIDDAQTGSM
jgi:hypothetical protein